MSRFQFLLVGLLIVLLTVLAGSVATAKEIIPSRVVISSDLLSAPLEVPTCEDEVFLDAWIGTFPLRVAAPEEPLANPLAVLHLWLVTGQSPCDVGEAVILSRDPDWSVEYHHIGSASYLRYPEERGAFFIRGAEFWTKTSPAMERFLAGQLGISPMKKAQGFPLPWVYASTAAGVVAALLAVAVIRRSKRKKAAIEVSG